MIAKGDRAADFQVEEYSASVSNPSNPINLSNQSEQSIHVYDGVPAMHAYDPAIHVYDPAMQHVCHVP